LRASKDERPRCCTSRAVDPSRLTGIAFDADNGRLFFRRNGSWANAGDPVAGTNAAFTGLTSGPYYPMVGDGTSGVVTVVFIANFGASTFSSAAPTGYSGLR